MFFHTNDKQKITKTTKSGVMNAWFLMLVMMMVVASPVWANASTGSTKASQADFARYFEQDFEQCLDTFYQRKAPALVGTKGSKLNQKLQALCFDGFAVLHSGVSRTPFWSAEHLTRQRIRQAKGLARVDSFREESRLPHAHRAELKDYNRSGFDRGHLAPNGDMANESQQYDSFSLANIAPQNGTHNRNIWRHIETATRDLVLKHGDVYVVTGVVFGSSSVERIGGRVLVPSHFFKAIYIPSLNQAGVYYSPNAENGDYQIISLSQLAKKTGMDVMPNLPKDIKQTAYSLPAVSTDGKPSHKKTTSSSSTTTKESSESADLTQSSGWLVVLLSILEYLVNQLMK